MNDTTLPAMTWIGAAQIIALGLADGTEEGKRLARLELTKLAKIADLAGEMATMLRGIDDRLDIEAVERHQRKEPNADVFPCSACRGDIKALLARAAILSAS